MDAIVTRELSKVYRGLKAGRRSLDRLNLSVREGEVYGFLGRNGAGKTTAIKLLTSLLKPSGGDAAIFGESVRSRAARRLLGYLPEQPYFYEYLNPRETIEFYGRLRGLSPAERTAEWERLSVVLDLKDIADQRIKGFSKGMRQRIGFAVALVDDPPLLILDEPMSGLDPVGRRNIRELILRLRDEGKTIFFSSHVLGDVEQICDRVGILVQGKLLQEGRIEDLLREDHTSRIDVTAAGLDEAQARSLSEFSESSRIIDGRVLLSIADADAANRAVREIQQMGGELLEYMPVKTRLEDYFIETLDRDAVAVGKAAE